MRFECYLARDQQSLRLHVQADYQGIFKEYEGYEVIIEGRMLAFIPGCNRRHLQCIQAQEATGERTELFRKGVRFHIRNNPSIADLPLFGPTDHVGELDETSGIFQIELEPVYKLAWPILVAKAWSQYTLESLLRSRIKAALATGKTLKQIREVLNVPDHFLELLDRGRFFAVMKEFQETRAAA